MTAKQKRKAFLKELKIKVIERAYEVEDTFEKRDLQANINAWHWFYNFVIDLRKEMKDENGAYEAGYDNSGVNWDWHFYREVPGQPNEEYTGFHRALMLMIDNKEIITQKSYLID
jgi:hypothetical protein